MVMISTNTITLMTTKNMILAFSPKQGRIMNHDSFPTFFESGGGDVCGSDNGGDVVGDQIRNINHKSTKRSKPIIINEYGFPPINPDVANFGDNYYVQEEGLRLPNNNYCPSISQRSATPK